MERRPLASHPGIRALCVIAAVAGFLAVASVISPTSTTAMPAGPPSRGEELPSLGQLHGLTYTIDLHAGPDGQPRYTVTDAQGNLIARQATAEELRSIDPELDPEAWVAIPHAEVDTDDDF